MRATLFFFLLFISVSLVNAQSYYPFPDSIARWVNTGYTTGTSFALSYSEFYCMNDEDTIMNSKAYTKIDFCITGDYKGAIRDTAGVVYYVPKDSLTEYVLYDFTLIPGDTVNYYDEGHYGPGGYVSEYVVGVWDTSSIILNGQVRRVIQIESSTWTEGIGCSQGMFVTPQSNISNYAPFMYCMSEGDTTFMYVSVATSFQGNCPLLIGLDELELKPIEIFPVPANNFINARINSKVKSIWVTNTMGMKFDTSMSFNSDIHQIDVSALSPGIYFLNVNTEANVYSEKFLVE